MLRKNEIFLDKPNVTLCHQVTFLVKPQIIAYIVKMKASEFKYLQNSTIIFSKSLQKPSIEGERGLVLGLEPLEATLYAQHLEIRLGPTDDWSAIQVDWSRRELSCQYCSGYESWLSYKNGCWVCDECGEYEITREHRLINKFRRMIRSREMHKLRTIRKGLVERRQAMELEGLSEIHSAPTTLLEAQRRQEYCKLPFTAMKHLSLEEYGRLIWAENGDIWAVGYD